MLTEFRKFIMRGNVIDLAVGVIIGGAFGAIVSSLVNDIIMPPIGMVLGRVNFTDLFIALDGNAYQSLEAAQTAGAPTLNYGVFINTLLNFLIIGLVIFFAIRAINRLSEGKEKPEPAPTEKACPYCATNIPISATRCPNCTSQL
jgi:large conductance mechanosensitive channel